MGEREEERKRKQKGVEKREGKIMIDNNYGDLNLVNPTNL